MQDEHAHVGAGIARGERLTVGPDADDGIAPAGVELGDDSDPGRALAVLAHQWRWVASVSAASRALR